MWRRLVCACITLISVASVTASSKLTENIIKDEDRQIRNQYILKKVENLIRNSHEMEKLMYKHVEMENPEFIEPLGEIKRQGSYADYIRMIVNRTELFEVQIEKLIDATSSSIYETNDEFILKMLADISNAVDGAENSLKYYEHESEFVDIFKMLEEQRHYIRDISRVIKNPSKVPKRSVLATTMLDEDPREPVQTPADISKLAMEGDNAKFDHLLHELKSDELETQINGLIQMLKIHKQASYMPSEKKILESFEILEKLLDSNEYEILSKTASLLNEFSIKKAAIIIKSGILKKLIKLLDSEQTIIVIRALEVFGNCVVFNGGDIKAVLETGIMKKIPNLFLEGEDDLELFLKDNRAEKQALYFLETISYEMEGAQAITDKKVLSYIVEYFTVNNYDLRKAAARIICNIAIKGTEEQLSDMIKIDGIFNFCKFIGEEYTNEIEKYWAFEGIYEFLKRVGNNRVKEFGAKIDKTCVKNIRDFQNSEDEYIIQLSKEIVALIDK